MSVAKVKRLGVGDDRTPLMAVPPYQPPGTIGQWRTVHVADADRLTHFSIAVDPARPDVIEKYVAVVYADPSLSANYFRGESLYSFDEALERAAGLIASKDALVVEDY